MTIVIEKLVTDLRYVDKGCVARVYSQMHNGVYEYYIFKNESEYTIAGKSSDASEDSFDYTCGPFKSYDEALNTVKDRIKEDMVSSGGIIDPSEFNTQIVPMPLDERFYADEA